MQPIPFILKQQTAMDAEEYKEIRKALALTQGTLAKLLKIDIRTIQRREAGETSVSYEAELAIRSLLAALPAAANRDKHFL